ncbi:MAG: ComEC/Rec2 family competence protein [Terriglobia bacterium]
MACCFALGIAVARPDQSGQFPALHTARSIPFTLLAGSLCLLAGLIALRERRQRTAASLAFAGFVFAGATAAMLFEFRFPPDHASHLAESALSSPVRIEGRLASTPLRTAYGLQFDLELASVQSGGRKNAASGNVRLRLEASGDPATGGWAMIEALRLERGDAIRALARVRRPRVYRNPGSFDFRRWMESIEDVYLVGTIENPSHVERLASPPSGVGKPPGWWHAATLGMTRSIEKTRQRLLEAIDGLYPPWLPQGRDGSVLKAVLLGDRSSLDSDTLESFRKAGLYHLLVIAGLHVGLLALLVTALLRRLGLRSTARSLLVLTFLLGYASLVEQRAPTLRATLMISLFLVARLLYRERSLLNAVGLAALVLLLSRPAWLFESGFQLSFAAALLIAGLAVPVLERTTEPYGRGLRRLEVTELDPSLEPRIAQFRLDLRSLAGWLQSRFRFLNRHPSLAPALVVGPAQAAIWTGNILLFSAILQLGLLLPMAETFHRVTYAGIGLNAVAIPVMTLLLALAVPTVLLAAFAPALGAGPARVLALMMKALFALTRLPHLPAWLSYRVPEPPIWVAWGFAVSATAAAWALSACGKPADDDTKPPTRKGREELDTEKRRYREEGVDPTKVPVGSRHFPFFSVPRCLCAGSSLAIISPLRSRRIFWASLGTLAVFAALVSTHPFPPRLPTGGVEVTALDCDGGDALFLVLPDGRTMLVDAGAGRGLGGREGAFQRGRWDPGEDIVSPYLWSRGVKSIDVLVVTDTRDDRLGGVSAVLRNFRVGELWRAANGLTGQDGRGSASYGPVYGEVFDEVHRQGIRVRELAAGDSIAWGRTPAPTLVKVLWPPSAANLGYYVADTRAKTSGDAGDDSLALRISAGGVNLLFPGEMSGGVEKRLVRSGVTLASDLLQVARHGAKTSTTDEFLARVAPRIALITAAGASARSSPNPETLDRLRTAGVQVFRTNLDGAIAVTWLGAGSSGKPVEPVWTVRCYSRSKVR